jgi:NitT/TauT family transport system permease protein
VSRPRARAEVLYPVLSISLLLVAWHLVVVGFQLRPTFLPTPAAAFGKVVRSYDIFAIHGLVTIAEVMAGFLLSVVIGVATAFLMVWSRTIDKVVSPVLVFLQTVPYISVAPLLLVWFGFGLTPKIVVSFLMGYFPIVVAVAAGMNAVESEMVELMRSMAASKWQLFWKGRLPNALPYLFSGAKISVALATSGAIVGEYVGSDRGLGYLIVVANGDTNAELLFGTIIVVSAFGVSFFWLIRWIETIAMPWHVVFRPGAEAPRTTGP